MAKNIVQQTEIELLNGKTHQEIFNEIMTHTDLDIHRVANVIRRIPTKIKREKYRTLNLFLTVALCIIGTLNLVGFILFFQNLILLIPTILCAALIFFIFKFKRNAHLITGILLMIGLIRNLYPLLSDFTTLGLLFIIFVSGTSALAFYLAVKLPSDYQLNKELLKNNPGQRVDSILFIE